MSNHLDLTKYAVGGARNVVGEDNIIIMPHGMLGAEDFAHYSRIMPATYLMLGSANEEKGLTAAQHNPKFDFDEEALYVAVKLFYEFVFGIEEYKKHVMKEGDSNE